MFERLKNFIYDISDIVIALLIIGVLFFSVSWKINNTLNIDLSHTDNRDVVVINPTTEIPTSTMAETTTEEFISEETTTEAPIPSTTTASADLSEEYISFQISEGQLGHTIAQNLKNQGLISNVNEFVRRAFEMGVDSKLQIGTFKLKKTDDLDTILRILSGGRR